MRISTIEKIAELLFLAVIVLLIFLPCWAIVKLGKLASDDT